MLSKYFGNKFSAALWYTARSDQTRVYQALLIITKTLKEFNILKSKKIGDNWITPNIIYHPINTKLTAFEEEIYLDKKHTFIHYRPVCCKKFWKNRVKIYLETIIKLEV